jgi:outer membrane biosynthesis protein TonB
MRCFLVVCAALFSSAITCLTLSAQTTLPVADSADPKKQLQLKAEESRLLREIRRYIAALPPLPEAKLDDSPALQAQRMKQRELISRVEEIEARIKLYESLGVQRTPPGTPRPEVQRYYDRIRARIESAGNADLPKDSNGSIYGSANISFTLNSQGHIESIAVLSNTSEALVTYSKALLKRLEPFETFPPGIAKDFDQLVIITPFNFKPSK